MGIINYIRSWLSSKKSSTKPEDYKKFYVKWTVNGHEYGPYSFINAVTRRWSGPPLMGRFVDEKKWRQYSYFLDIIEKLDATEDQKLLLKKLNITFDEENVKMLEAKKMISEKEKEIQREKEIERQENYEKFQKMKQPFTPEVKEELKQKYKTELRLYYELRKKLEFYGDKILVKQFGDKNKKIFTNIGSDWTLVFFIEQMKNKNPDTWISDIQNLIDSIDDIAKEEHSFSNFTLELHNNIDDMYVEFIKNKIKNTKDEKLKQELEFELRFKKTTKKLKNLLISQISNCIRTLNIVGKNSYLPEWNFVIAHDRFFKK